jgi:pectate lyase
MKFVDLVRNYTEVEGIGPITLGEPVAGFDSIADHVVVGDQFYYSLVSLARPTEKETGVGTVQADGSITRAPTGAAVDFSPGTKTIALTVGAAWFTAHDAGGGGGGAPAILSDGAHGDVTVDNTAGTFTANFLSVFGRSLAGAADGAVARGILGLGGLGSAAFEDVNAFMAAGAATAFGLTIMGAADAAALNAILNIQALAHANTVSTALIDSEAITSDKLLLKKFFLAPKARANTRVEALSMTTDYSFMKGFAKYAGTTGGAGGTTFWVDNNSDDVNTPNSFRWCLAQGAALAGAPVQIIFENRRPMRIVPKSRYNLYSNLTISAPGRNVLFIPKSNTVTMFADGCSNFILRFLRFKQSIDSTGINNKLNPGDVGYDANQGGPADQADAISINAGTCDKFWVDQCSGDQISDGCLDISASTLTAATANTCRYSVSRCHWRGHYKTMLSGSLSTDPADQLVTAARKVFGSYYNNWYDHCAERMPRTSSLSYIDSVNNIFDIASVVGDDGLQSGSYGIASFTGAHAQSRGDLFRSLDGVATKATNRDATSALAVTGSVAEGALTFDTGNEGNIAALPAAGYDLVPDAVPAAGPAREAWRIAIQAAAGAEVNSAPYGEWIYVPAATTQLNGLTVRAATDKADGRYLLVGDREPEMPTPEYIPGSSATVWTRGTTLGIVGDAITVDTTSTAHALTPEVGNTDNLVTINGGTNFQTLMVRPTSAAHTITIKGAGGNIATRGSNDVNLVGSTSMALLWRDDSIGKWVCFLEPEQTGTGGSVTTFSAVANNGLTQSVTNPTTTPQLTIGLSANGVALDRLAAATAGAIAGASAAGSMTYLTPAQAKTVLGIAASDVSGLGSFATGTNAANLTGTMAVAQLPARSGGDVTGSAGSGVLTIGANKVTRAMLSVAAGATLLGATAAGNVSDLTAAQAKTFLAITTADVSGTYVGSQFPAHTGGDVTSSAGSLVLTIGAGKVTRAMMANTSAATVLGSTAAGAVSELTSAQVKTFLGLTASDVSGLSAFATSTDIANATGTLNAARIAANALALTKIAQAGAASLVGALAAGDHADLTPAQVNTILPAATTTLKGLVPAPGSSTGKFLKDDLSWAAVSATAGGADRNVQFNNAGAVDGSAHVDIDAQGDLRLDSSATPATPGADQITDIPCRIAAGGGRVWPKVRTEDGINTTLQAHFGRNSIVTAQALGGTSAALTWNGLTALTVTGTATLRSVATTSRLTRAKRVAYVSAATAGSAAGWTNTANTMNQWTVGGAAGAGFLFVCRFAMSDAAAVAGAHQIVGMRNATAAPTVTTNPNTLTNIIALCQTNGSTNWMICYGGSAAQTPIDTGMAINSTDLLEFTIYARPDDATKCAWRLENISTGVIASGVLTGTAGTALPAVTTLMGPIAWRSNNATALAVGIDVCSFYIESDI